MGLGERIDSDDVRKSEQQRPVRNREAGCHHVKAVKTLAPSRRLSFEAG